MNGKVELERITADSQAFIGQAAKCVSAVMAQSLKRNPLPTPESKIDETLSSLFPEEMQPFKAICTTIGAADVYIGMIFSFLSDKLITAEHIHKIEELSKSYTLSTVLVPYFAGINKDVQSLVGANSPIRLVRLSPPLFDSNFSTSSYYMVPGFSQGVLNRSNIVASSLVLQLRKTSHIVLSDIAAENYDADYENSSAGTAFAMSEEKQILENFAATLTNKRRAIELGCGTGRHSFALGDTFEHIYAYDFSSRMIDVAQRNKAKLRDRDTNGNLIRWKVDFAVRDIEMHPPELMDQVDLCAGLFGMGSFVEDIDGFLRTYYEHLADQGGIIFSFYNREALIYLLPPPWRYPSISARLEPDREELTVSLPTGEVFRIFCKAYTPDVIQRLFSRYFTNVQVKTFPTISGFLPKEYLAGLTPQSKEWKIFRDIDKLLVQSETLNVGNYIVVTGTKQAHSRVYALVKGNARAADHTQICGMPMTVMKHPPRRTAVDIAATLKSEHPYLQVVLAYSVVTDADAAGKPILCIIPAGKKVSEERLGQLIAPSGSVRVARPREVLDQFGADDTPLPITDVLDHVEIVVDSQLAPAQHFVVASGVPGYSYLVQGSPAQLHRAIVGEIVQVPEV